MLHPAAVHDDTAPAMRRAEHAGRVGVLLVNLGTPDAATPAATRRYLAQFLSDPRVVEIPRLAWWPVLHGVVLRTRPAKSARKYATIWTREGSPLAVYTARQAALLRGYLGERGAAVDVRWAMRYGRPAIAAELDALVAQGCARVLVFPAYPQYCAATTASAFDDVTRWMQRTRTLPELRFVNEYHVDGGYLQALASQVRRHWKAEGRGRPLVLSFHGMPERTRDRGDPYHGQCLETARRLAAALGLAADQVHVTFQSRFGAAAWLRPYTDETLAALARAGCDGVDVMCPGFSCDCLETLEEIAIEGRATFLAAGGKSFHYLPCLNDSPEGMGALAEVALRHLQGWLAPCPSEP